MSDAMNNENETFPVPSHRSGAWGRIVRILIVVIILAGIGVGIYFAAPYVYDKYILPVETNTERLGAIESKQVMDVRLLTDQITALQSRLSGLETGQAQNAQAISEAAGRFDALETAIAANTASVTRLEGLQTRLDALYTEVEGHDALLTGSDSALADLRRDITFSRATDLLSRALMYLSQSNFGLATQDVRVARGLLGPLQSEIPTDQSAQLQAVLERIDLALSNLPAYPVIAVSDVGMAWQFLVTGLPAQPTVTTTPTTVVPAPTTPTTVTPTTTTSTAAAAP